jgi:hypothetical protein
MNKPHRLRVAALAAVTISAAAVAIPSAGATPATETAPTLEVVASGLNHPRGLVPGPAGTVLIAEAGGAGEGPCLDPSPGTGNQPACLSTTGSLTLAGFGQQFRIVDDLASIGDPAGAATSGPHDLAITSEGVLVLNGFAHNPQGRAELGSDADPLGQLVLVDWHGEQHAVADLAAHEGANNPDGRPGFLGSWSNPFSMIEDGDNHLVVDSGANTLLEVTPDGSVTTRAVFPTREVPGPGGDPVVMESVPTGMARGPDGTVYVAELTGFPFPAGGAQVYALAPGQSEPQVVSDGFTNVIDLAVDSEGRLLVLEIFANGITSGNPAGALKRIEPDGSVTTLIDSGLITPTKLAVASDGAIFIANKGTSVGGGEVVRFTPPS